MLRKLSFFIISVILVSSILVPPAFAEAQTMDYTSGDFQYTVNGDNTSATITKYTGTGTAVTVDKVTNGSTTYNVTAIGDNAFKSKTAIISITLPDSLTSIGVSAFQGCTKLSVINLPDNLTSIGDYAFNSCASLASITLPASKLQSIPSNAFSFSGLQTISVPEGIKSIGDSAFQNCSSLGTVSLPTTLNSLGNAVFKDCSTLGSINIPDGIASIPDFTFNGCSALEGIVLPSGIKSIGTFAFSSSGLNSIDLPDGITDIGENAFSFCSALASTELPDGITRIRLDTFLSCTKLGSITIPNGVQSVEDHAFGGCGALKTVNITLASSGLKTIGESAFSSCTSLESISIPGGVSTISKNAFYNCYSLNSISLSEGITTVGVSAFEKCVSLESVTFPVSLSALGDDAYNGCVLLRTAYFGGNAPSDANFGIDVFNGCAAGFAVYYLSTNSGFSNPFHGYEARAFDPKVNYTVSFDLNGKTGTPPDSQTVHENVKLKQPADPGCIGYSVAGWYSAGTDGIEWNFSGDGATDNITLYAHWTPIQYDITYNLNGGDVTDNPKKYTIEDENTTLKQPTRTGYTFTGWTGTDLSVKTNDVTITKGSHGARTYTANWKANTHIVKFYSDGDYKDSQSVDYGSRLTSVPSLTKTNYEVEGWYLDDGTFLNKWNIQSDTMPDKDVNLYAHWTGIKITVTFNPGTGARVTPSSMTAAYTESYGSMPTPTKSGYYFYGWYTGANGMGDNIKSGDTVNVTHDITLYAKWVKNSTVSIGKPALTVKVKNYKTIALTWKAAKNAQGYEIYRSDGNSSHFNLIATISGRSYTDTGLNSIKYYYIVRAYRVPYITKVTSDSSAKSAKPVWAPITLKAAAKSYNNVALKWNSAAGATGYYIYRSTSKNGSYAQIGTVRNTSYTDGSLTVSGTYYYKIAAFDDSANTENPLVSPQCKYKSVKVVVQSN